MLPPTTTLLLNGPARSPVDPAAPLPPAAQRPTRKDLEHWDHATQCAALHSRAGEQGAGTQLSGCTATSPASVQQHRDDRCHC